MAAKKRSILVRMQENPRADWGIKDIAKLCDEYGLALLPPSSGSHYKVCSEHLRDILTIPAHRPIKAPYIRQLISYVQGHTEAKEAKHG
jgi:hypothetical protein